MPSVAMATFPSLAPASDLREQAGSDEPLGQVRLRLFSAGPCDRLDAEPWKGAAEGAGHFFVWETASTADSLDRAVPLIAPQAYNNPFQDSPWIGVGPPAPSSSASIAESFDRAVHPLVVAPQVAYGNPYQDSPWIGMESHGTQNPGKTTLMLRNLPEGFTRSKLEELLEAEGFAARYDFLYLPAELASGACFGYALINMATASDARFFIEHFQGFDDWPAACDKRAVAHMSEELQGLSELTERYRNSPLMHPSVPDAMRPAIYSNGSRVEFPEPTAPLKPPRARKANRKRAV